METSDPKVTNVRRGAAKPIPPAAPVIKDSQGRQIVTDSKGRRLTLRELTLLDEQDLLIALGAEASSIPMVLGRALLAARVGEVDGDHCDIPHTRLEYRAMMQQVGKEGLAAVMGAAEAENDPEQDSEIETAKN